MIRYSVYILIDPDDNKPFYVGMSKNVTQRVQAHICAGMWQLDEPKYLKINKILLKHGYILYMILTYTKHYKKAVKLERKHYNQLVSSGINLLQSSNHFRCPA